MAKLAVLLTIGFLAASILGEDNCTEIGDGQIWYSDNCTQKHLCLNGKQYTNPMECEVNTHCEKQGNDESCACDEGFVFDSNVGGCVDARAPDTEENRCRDIDGNVFSPGKRYVIENCQYQKICVNKKIYVMCYQCPQNSVCKDINGRSECVCEGKFHWDAKKNNCLA
ncbi:hypothetical protein L596_023439 [Steinernema carpocapsae]|uniref:TILa domain-containing protein n=1 Tax=Steinernema carpocapsae TaxID=34508 RepID=A0A4U5MDM8_STECR|nr:hypothetical protein L596_023439 [Steinernema carpocapsae]